MHRPTLLFGDSLPLLEPFAASGDVIDCRAERPSSLTTSARAFVLAVDLREFTSWRRGRRQLKKVLANATTEARRYGQFVHLIVVYVTATPGDARLEAAAAGFALRVHASLERELGESVDVVLLDATRCDAPQLLAERLTTHIQRPAGTASDSALNWGDVHHRSIAVASTSDNC